MVAVVEIRGAEGSLAELAHRPGLSGADDVIVRGILLKHAPHRIDIVAGEAPVAPRVEVAEAQLLRLPELDARHTVRDLACDELEAAARTLVVEEDARDGEETEALAVVHGDPVTVDLRHTVGAAWVERRGLALRSLDHLAELLARAGLVEARLWRRLAHRLEHSRHTEGRELPREHGL